MRTQEEILERFLNVEDLFNTQKCDLANFLEFERAKHLLSPESIEKIEKGEEKWTLFTDPIEQILEYLPFAYEKANNQRGLSAVRSLYHMETWIWLTGDEEFYREFKRMRAEEHNDYGLSILDKISEQYGYVKV